jgi:hypothetical protein
MNIYCCLADAIAVLHLAYVAFVVFGMAAILTGIVFRWTWVRNFWFRSVHLAMIAVVVAESLLGILCPLTDWEDRLRAAGGMPIKSESFIGRWVNDLLFVHLPHSVVLACYLAFGVAVLAVFILAPPRWPWRMRE